MGSENSNSPQDLLDYWNIQPNWGRAAYDIRQQFNFNFNFNFSAALPFGKDRHFANNMGPVAEAIVGGWQFNGLFTAETGFPLTPLIGVNVSGNGDTMIEDVPNLNQSYTGPLYNPVSVRRRPSGQGCRERAILV